MDEFKPYGKTRYRFLYKKNVVVVLADDGTVVMMANKYAFRSFYGDKATEEKI